MTEQQRKRFAEIYGEYATTSRALTPKHLNRIQSVSLLSRAYAKAPDAIDGRAVRELVMPLVNKVATVSGAPDATWKRWHIKRTEAAFIPLLKEMFGVAATSGSITREQFRQWRNEFFKCAGYNANQTYNRLVFACFPNQFCSVVAPSRLKAAIGKLHDEGLMASVVVDLKSDGAWFDLCEAIVPVVRDGLPSSGFAGQISFIAAIADGGPRE